MEVHRQLGSGFLEGVYHEALAIESRQRAIPFGHEVDLPIHYKGHPLTCSYRADFICFDAIVVELKALPALRPREHSQVIKYLKATNLRRGLLFNFGTPRLDYKRIIHSPNYLRSSASSADVFPSEPTE
jgi:GxxExxY protein